MFSTANKAICIPSIIPTKHISTKNTITDTAAGIPSHMVVFLAKSAPSVTANANPRIKTDTKTRTQKKRF